MPPPDTEMRRAASAKAAPKIANPILAPQNLPKASDAFKAVLVAEIFVLIACAVAGLWIGGWR
jgi:hypothetical protein